VIFFFFHQSDSVIDLCFDLFDMFFKKDLPIIYQLSSLKTPVK